MGATIKASCDECGSTELILTVPQVRVRINADDNSGCYVFACPTCAAHIAKPAEARLVDILIAAGCRLTVWRWPLELSEIHDGPPLTYNDVIDLHDLLEDDGEHGWRERLSA